MAMLKTTSYLLLVSLTICFVSCCVGDPSPTAESGMDIVFLNENSGHNVFDSPAPYPKDSLKIYNELHEPQYFIFHGNNEIALEKIYDPAKDQNSLSQEICKTYLFQFLAKEIDTVKICFQLKMSKHRCEKGNVYFSNMKAYYEGNLIYSQNHDYYEIIIKK